MKTKKLLVAIAILAMIFSGFSNPANVSADWSKVDQHVLDQMDANGTAEFIAIMTVQADVSGAAKLDTKVEKTTFVYNQLTRTAAETQPPLLAYLKSQGVTYQSFYIYNMISVSAGRSTLEWLTARSDVAHIVTPPDPRTEPVTHELPVSQALPGPQLPALSENMIDQAGEAVEWNITRVKAPEVWAMGDHGEGMVVADNDTGVEYTHPALVNKYRGNLGSETFDHNYNWWDAWGGSPSPVPVDYDGHGTHTMGTMVGDDGAGNQIGMAPGAKWIACAGLNLECLEFFLTPWDLNHQNPDPSRAPDAINNSWYDPSGFDYRPIIQALNAAGIAVIKSAGNTGPSCSTISNPGQVPEIIATAAFGQGDVIASFSARGPMSTYGETILKPEVAAPGVNVRSSVPGGGYEGGWDGTSMAAPHSTGLVALMWSAATCIRGDVPLTKQIMMETAEAKIDAQCPPYVGHPNDVWGWGILDAQAAVQAAMAICGGTGELEGTVTDATTSLPIQDVEVLAQSADGFERTDWSDPTGFYSMTLVNDAYDVTASVYGYETGLASVVVVTDAVTVQDFALTPLPTYSISGHVYESGTNNPLIATVEFTDAPVPPVTTDPTGYYSIEVAQGTWQMLVQSAFHQPESQQVVVMGDLTQDFYLDPLPCILLVDDDNNAPDTTPYYAAALDNLGYTYNIFDTGSAGGPDISELQGYSMVLWYSGDAFGGTAGPNAADETNLTTYLDSGGKLFLDSQDYLYDFGLTEFGQSYLGINSFTSDTGDATSITGTSGDPIGDGLGPYPLTYPSGFSDYGDIVTAGAGASVAFHAVNNSNNLDLDKDGGIWQTVFFGTSWAPIYNNNASNGQVVMQRIVDFFGSCVVDPITGLEATNDSPTYLGDTTNLAATIETGTGVSYLWSFGDGDYGSGANQSHSYPALGSFTATVTATNSLGSEETTTLVTIVDAPITGLQATNDSPTELGNSTHLTATIATGTNVSYAWDFGDGILGSGENPTHIYPDLGSYTAVVTATNSVGSIVATTLVSIVDAPIEGLTVENDSPTELGYATYLTVTVEAGTNVNYTWAFGDSSTGSGATVAHIYPAVGSYTAIVTATNGTSSESAPTLVTIVDVPIEGLVATNDSPTELGSLTMLSATKDAGTNVAYAWDFGDGTQGSGIPVSHTYPAVGSYTAIVTATNGMNSESATTLVTIIDVPIDGLAAANNSPTELGDLTTLNATITSGTNVTYDWAFGDGAYGNGAMDTHTYLAIGSYTAIVTATNGTNTTSATTVVTITDIPIQGLAAENDSPTLLGDATTFTATVTAGSNVVYTWDFGDGSTGIGPVVAHTYAAIGTFNVTVTATNTNGEVTMETVATVYTLEPPVYYTFLPFTTR